MRFTAWNKKDRTKGCVKKLLNAERLCCTGRVNALLASHMYVHPLDEKRGCNYLVSDNRADLVVFFFRFYLLLPVYGDQHF